MRNHLLNFHPLELEQYILSLGEKKYRSNQISNWIFQNNSLDLNNMTTLSLGLRKKISEDLLLYIPEIIKEQISSDGTRKFLLKLADNSQIEMVIIPFKEKNTLCISSQVGCARNCQFCATGSLGMIRNLETYEILMQVFLTRKLLTEGKLTNIVFMGMGEPLDNYDNVIKSIRILQHEKGFKFSPRRITVSTAGIIPGIDKLAQCGLKLKLAVSLNSAIQEKRETIMPVTKIYSLQDLKKSLVNFNKNNPYRITFEYVMIKDFNISRQDALSLRKFIGDISAKVNLLKWNQIEGYPFQTPDEKEIDSFINLLLPATNAITFRQSRGIDIKAACGQLAADYK